MVSHTPLGLLQSLLLLQGSLVHVPTPPLVVLQYFPVEQLFTTPESSDRSRQPTVHTPVLAVLVSQ
jgi:hypothetical protein